MTEGRFHGELLQRREAAGFVMSESQYVPDARISRHRHERAYFSILLDGDYLETCDGRSRTCRRSTVVFHPAGELHADRFLGRGGRLFRCEVEPAWLDRVRVYSSVVDAPREFDGGPLAWLLTRLYREFGAMDDLSPLAVEGIALELVAAAARGHASPSEGRPPRWLERVKEILRADLTCRPSLDALAGEAGVHPLHLARTFRRFLGASVGEYVRRARVDFAARALSSSELPLAEIAARAGFTDQSHFTKIFKRETGLTPGGFRRMRRTSQGRTSASGRYKIRSHHE